MELHLTHRMSLYEAKLNPMSTNTYLTDAWLIEFTMPDGTVPTLQFGEETIPLRVAFGTVTEDLSRRWEPGNWCCTSAVISLAGNVIKTLHSNYQIGGELKRITLPIQARELLMQGIGPEVIQQAMSGGDPDQVINKLLHSIEARLRLKGSVKAYSEPTEPVGWGVNAGNDKSDQLLNDDEKT